MFTVHLDTPGVGFDPVEGVPVDNLPPRFAPPKNFVGFLIPRDRDKVHKSQFLVHVLQCGVAVFNFSEKITHERPPPVNASAAVKSSPDSSGVGPVPASTKRSITRTSSAFSTPIVINFS